jgi:hypothetical protein
MPSLGSLHRVEAIENIRRETAGVTLDAFEADWRGSSRARTRLGRRGRLASSGRARLVVSAYASPDIRAGSSSCPALAMWREKAAQRPRDGEAKPMPP